MHGIAIVYTTLKAIYTNDDHFNAVKSKGFIFIKNAFKAEFVDESRRKK